MPPKSAPEGMHLDAKTSKKWQISNKLGSGACGTVHSLLKTSGKAPVIQYCVKIAILPPPSTNKKKKKSDVEKNADLLNHENILYRNVLNALRGHMIPDVPMAGSKGPVGFGDLKTDGSGSGYGYRFLVMEQMEASFSSVVSTLCSRNSSSSSGIEIGPIAVRLIRLMEAVHATHHVFVDVKPENFMLASTSTSVSNSKKKSTSTSATAALADRIRMIDLGLMESSRDVMKNKHRMNQHPDAQLVGTPVYASLNVLGGHTVSKRDDLEACLYIIFELVLQIVDYSVSGSGNVKEDLLSWSRARSDEEIKRLKEEAMDLDTGSIWNEIGKNGNHKLRDIMREVFEVVTNLDFKEKPDYDGLAKIVSKLNVIVQSTSSRTASISSKAKGTRRTKTSIEDTTAKRKVTKVTTSSKTAKQRVRASPTSAPSSPEQEGYDEDVLPTHFSSRAERAAAREAARSKSQEEEEIVELSDSESDIEMISVCDEEEEHNSDDGMDWETMNDENQSINSNSNNTSTRSSAYTANANMNETKDSKSKKSGPPASLKLECIEGPHSGETLELTGTIVIGTNPGKKIKSQSYAIADDKEASSAHAKLVLNHSGSKKNGVLMVKVFDLKSNTGTLINGKKLPKGSSRQAFVRDKIQMGNSVFRILKI